ncbi:NAD(P)H-binding protein [Couchioplanes caeruleus]|uniref:NAD(P)-dependent oxidoreductase n=1 Tax=Couchioplanes caeruleus TaxID=56438 RepID=UPI0020C10AD9|nr:NAD(P)H-binding protein [Couchioplanes caeruleus]UQU68286.1 NAD(P)H-binding protein [Couchioplanes caeruleus]
MTGAPRIAVLGASGAVGRLLVTQALDRGLEVTAIARDPARVPVADQALLVTVAADVHDAGSVARAAGGSDVLVSGLGVRGGPPGTLTAGARAAVASGVDRVVWLGAYGTGESARQAGAVTRAVLRMLMRNELADKVAADATVLAAGGTVFHAGPMSDGPLASGRRTVPLGEAPRRIFPTGVSRATVAAAMLDEALTPHHPGRTVVPLTAF